VAALSTQERARIHAALGDEHRLALVDALLLSDRSPSELGQALGFSSNLLAHHLDILEAAGVIERTVSAGDRRKRYVRLRREALAGLVTSSMCPASHVLFVCTHNSARSQFAAALWNQASAASAESAGTHPASRVHPQAVATALRHGLDLSNTRPQSLEAVAMSPDLVVTVCDRAYEELPRVDAPVLHWSIPDPADAGTRSAFEAAFHAIRQRVSSLVPLIVTART
jgi:protein-tyrosine-phosphatase/DNA-binding transcriptional ArsR family regulator